MGISLTGVTIFTKGNIAKALITFFLFFALFVYFYGPPLIPALRNSAIDRCNVEQGGDYRSYKVEWLSASFLDNHFPPHWECSNLHDPDKPRSTSAGTPA